MRVLPRWLCVVALVCCVGQLPSCASSDSDAAWIEADVKADTERILWQVTVLALERNGYPIGSGGEFKLNGGPSRTQRTPGG